MAEFSKLVITTDGQALLAKMIAGTGDVEFTKVGASSTQYTAEELEVLTELTNLEQTSPISKVTRTNGVAIKVETAYTNTELTAGYYMRTLGLYAVDPDEGEILYAVTIETSGNCYMPPHNGVTVTGAYIQLITTVGNADSVSLEVDPGTYATIGDIQSLEEEVKKLQQKIENINLMYFDNLIHIGRELVEFTWEELSTIAKAGTATENNIHVGDYKVLTLSYTDRDVTTEYPVRMQVAGINTYAAYNFKSSFPAHHIDWISVELYPRISASWNDTYNNDNASINMPHPYGSSLLRTFLGMILGDLPENISPLIVQKQTYMEEKYDDKIPTGLTTATGSNLYATDLLWVPTEFEITGTIACGSKRWSPVGQMQYPLFANGGMINRMKTTSSGSLGSESWWTMTIADDSTNEAVCVGADGVVDTESIVTKLFVPVCFRL